MAKKSFINPFLLLLNDEGGNESGGGSVTGNTDPIPYSNWYEMYSWIDLDEDGETGTQKDYRMWWDTNEFTKEQWEAVNPDMPYNPEP